MRKLSDQFMAALQHGLLADLTNQIIADKDLDLQIRDGYLNIYYKGNSLLRLIEAGTFYQVDIHEKFCTGLTVPKLLDGQTMPLFLALIPALKDNIIRYGKSSLEIEYEQLIIRANNVEPRNNSEYFVLDRQYAIGPDRFDLIGIYWDRHGRKRGQEIPLCLMEVKFALNSDVKEIHDQLQRYYHSVRGRASMLAQEYELILRQKLELGLFDQTRERTEAMKTLHISPDINRFQFIIVLVDYNPYSKHLNLEKLRSLPFAKQISIFRSGFAMWRTNLEAMSIV
jgi:hypothetical protein